MAKRKAYVEAMAKAKMINDIRIILAIANRENCSYDKLDEKLFDLELEQYKIADAEDKKKIV